MPVGTAGMKHGKKGVEVDVLGTHAPALSNKERERGWGWGRGGKEHVPKPRKTSLAHWALALHLTAVIHHSLPLPCYKVTDQPLRKNLVESLRVESNDVYVFARRSGGRPDKRINMIDNADLNLTNMGQ